MWVLCEHTRTESHAENADTCPLDLDFPQPEPQADPLRFLLKSPLGHFSITLGFWRGLKMQYFQLFFTTI